jgi:hypothetical protein
LLGWKKSPSSAREQYAGTHGDFNGYAVADDDTHADSSADHGHRRGSRDEQY